MVSEWRAELVAAGTGAEAVRRAMTLLQAMYTVAIEWDGRRDARLEHP